MRYLDEVMDRKVFSAYNITFRSKLLAEEICCCFCLSLTKKRNRSSVSFRIKLSMAYETFHSKANFNRF